MPLITLPSPLKHTHTHTHKVDTSRLLQKPHQKKIGDIRKAERGTRAANFAAQGTRRTARQKSSTHARRQQTRHASTSGSTAAYCNRLRQLTGNVGNKYDFAFEVSHHTSAAWNIDPASLRPLIKTRVKWALRNFDGTAVSKRKRIRLHPHVRVARLRLA